MWTPVVDISVHQGHVNFAVMRNRGVEGLIFRATHGQTVDKRLHEYVAGARGAGYADADLGFYSFINPKRGTPVQCAAATVAAIAQVLGHTNTFYMLDIEAYAAEPPDKGKAPVFGAAYVQWLREHMAEVRRLAPDMRIMGYTNAAFWDGPVGQTGQRWVGDRALAAELEWIVPRYPVYPNARTAADPHALTGWLSASPKPPDPPQWADWALRIKPAGPLSPSGVPWAGWQFSAGFNRQGRAYGCSCDDLDLNIVRTEAWERWTGRSPGAAGTATAAATAAAATSAVLVSEPVVSIALDSTEVLGRGDRRESADGRSMLVHEEDGEVALYRKVWSTPTSGADTSGFVMQDDGNLVLYATGGDPLWFSGTHGHAGATARFDDTGALVVRGADGHRLWSTPPAEVAARPAAPTEPERPRTAVVQKGEGWFQVAERVLGDGGRWPEIAALNGGEMRVLHPGDELALP